jgi:hypothetical protein
MPAFNSGKRPRDNAIPNVEVSVYHDFHHPAEANFASAADTGLRQLRRGRRLSLQGGMLGVDACAAQLDHFAAQRFVRREIKLALAVIADVRRGVRAGLQSICANNFAGREVFNDRGR